MYNLLRKILLISVLAPLCVCLYAQGSTEFSVKGYYSFENSVYPAVPSSPKSYLQLSSEHYKTGNKSLKWKWEKDGASIRLNVPVPYFRNNPNPKETSVSSFVFWVYSPKETKGKLVFSFMKAGRKCCRFEYGLGFSGWRGAWVAFDRDMEGRPHEDMDAIEICISGCSEGSIYFDGIIPSVFEDVRYHTPDFQAPFINKDTDVHWLLLTRHWQNRLENVPESIGNDAMQQMQTISGRFVELVADRVKIIDYKTLEKRFESYGIHFNQDGTVSGKPIFFTRYGETFINLGISDASRQFDSKGQLLRKYNDLMFDIANAWRVSEDSVQKASLASMYVNMTKHLLDQGFAAGSGMGTLHHLGYSMRNFYNGPVIMKDILCKAGLSEQVQQAMEWFSGVGEVKPAPKAPGVDIDAFNTYLMSRLAAVLMLEDGPYKYAYIKAFSNWVDNGFRYTSGLLPSFKSDGTVFHHRRAYPAYATGGFDGGVKAIWLLKGTDFAISEQSHNNMKHALMEMRFYCNLKSFPLAMSGRHPDGEQALIPEQYARLADAGSPDGKFLIDKELAAAYLRIGPEKGRWVDKFAAADIIPEKSPTGAKAYNYNSSLSYRENDWLVTIAGHSRYLWASEIYVGANHYGRYLTHGSMQILGDSSANGGDGHHVSSFGSGYQVAGFDWCHIPGTTAAVIPMEEMKANVLNVDRFSGYEEMLLSDQWFAGGVNHKIDKISGHGLSGAYAMILHEHDKYNGSLMARKSFFAFDNKIICLGSGLKNSLQGSQLHTTLFQNTIDAESPTFFNGKSYSGLEVEETDRRPLNIVRDRFGNTWFVKDAKVVMTRSSQHSFHEETDAPTEGDFEKAYIYHWKVDRNGATEDYDSDNYEYMTVIHASDNEIKSYSDKLPYEVISKTDRLHAVRDLSSGSVAAAVFENGAVDDIVLESSPCMLMYSVDSNIITLSVSNPDLALYEGDSDEIFENGKRKERSIYSRKWVDNPCGATMVKVVLKGKWEFAGDSGEGHCISYSNGNTELIFHTSEGRTEEINLKTYK